MANGHKPGAGWLGVGGTSAAPTYGHATDTDIAAVERLCRLPEPPAPSLPDNEDLLGAYDAEPYLCGLPTSQRGWRDLVPFFPPADRPRLADDLADPALTERRARASVALGTGASLAALASVRLLI